jgi:hypothetical protein
MKPYILMNQFLKILCLIAISQVFYCLKARPSVFDLSKPTNSLLSYASLFTTKPTTTSDAPSNISYGTKSTFKLIPGQPVNFTPTVTGTVESWTISPTLPTGLVFNSKTGAITGSPDVSYLATGFSLNTFTITAINGTEKTEFNIQIQILKSGENVWTVMNGVSGGNTASANAALLYEPVCKCLYLAGTTSVNLNGEINPTTNSQAGFLSRFDLDGNRIWTRLFGTAAAAGTGVSGMAFDSSGNIFISGSAPAGNFSGLVITAALVGYITKYDSNGNRLWVNSTAPNIVHEGNGVAVDSSGNPYLAVAQPNGTTLHGFTHSLGSAALNIIKYDGSNGSYGGLATMINGSAGQPGIEPFGIQIASNGNIYVAGVTRPTNANRCGTGTTSYNAVLFRFNSSLTLLGCTQIPIGGTALNIHAYSFGITLDPSNNDAYLSGYFNVGSLDLIARVGTIDAFVTKIDSSGTKQWSRTLGVAGAVTAINMVGFANGKLFVSGVTSGNLPGASQAISGSQDMFIATFNSSGTQLSLRPQGTTGSTFICNGAGCSSGLTFDSNNTLYTSSYTNGNVGGITNPAGTDNSVFIVRNVQ